MVKESMNKSNEPVANAAAHTIRTFQNGGVAFQTKLEWLIQMATDLLDALENLQDVGPPPSLDESPFYDQVTRFEISLIERALARTRGSQIQAAGLLQVRATTLNNKIKQYRIEPRKFRRARESEYSGGLEDCSSSM